MKTIVKLMLPVLLIGACGNDDDDDKTLVKVSGNAIPFSLEFGSRIEGAEITILEFPEREPYVTGEDGYWEFADLPEGAEVSFVMEHPDYPLLQTGTFLLDTEDIERVTFQAPNHGMYDLLALVAQADPQAGTCQMVTTVTRLGKSMYDEGAHGEAGAVVTIDPPLPAEHGPIYFNEMVMPDFDYHETSADGGVLVVNAPPGEYRWTATKPGVEFRPIHLKCRAGVLVNASPPWGLQVLP